ncbi:SRPBCC domain-containing protein [Candidatus Parcubacteria bacterium]|nr:SRPBCC domain-containing protein [Candidatus Parcubacteria bacterium]
MKKPQVTPTISDAAIQRATGKTWREWFALLDAAGADRMSHKDVARWLQEQKLIESGWWAQSVTVEYEKARGLRVLGQTKDAGFQIGVQKTLSISPEAAWRLIISGEGVGAWLGSTDSKLTFMPGETYRTVDGTSGQIRTVSEGTKIRLTWQPPDWPQPSTLQIYLLPAGSHTSVRFHHEMLAGPEQREQMRRHWRGVLSELERLVSR